jgi:hypothetical protein
MDYFDSPEFSQYRFGEEPDTTTVTLELPLTAAHILERATRREGRTASDLVALLLADYSNR